MEKEQQNFSIRKCPECGTLNRNKEYCKNCGALLDMILRRKMEQQERMKERAHKAAQNKPNPVIAWFENAKNHPNLIITYAARFFYSIWLLIIAIGVILALIVGYIAA